MSAEAVAGSGTSERVPLGQLLIQRGFLSQAELDDALYDGARTGERLGEVVVRRGRATEDEVARLLAEQWELGYVERSAIWFDADALARLSREDAQRLEAMPTRIEDGRVVVAVAEPTEQRLAALRELIGENTVVVVVPKSALDAGLRSDLLRSSGSSNSAAPADPEPFVDERPESIAPAAAEPVREPEPEREPEPVRAPEPIREVEPEPERELRPVALAAVTELPRRRAELDDGDAESDAVAVLAEEARSVAERLATQAAAVRAQQQDLRARTQQYEQRIGELEQDLDEKNRDLDEKNRDLAQRTEQLEQLRAKLQGLLGSLDD